LETLVIEYPILIEASKNITNNHVLHLDLLHFALDALFQKENYKEIIESGGVRFYIVRIMVNQWRSNTSPFYKQFIGQRTCEIDFDIKDESEDLDVSRYEEALKGFKWYDRELFKIFLEENHNITSLSKSTGIPRTSIAFAINKVRKKLKRK
jgi:hypothetical protein